MSAEGAMTDDPSTEALYVRYGHHVHRRCRYLLGTEDAAWDATQEVFLKADRARAGFERRASWLTWLQSIATRHCLNLLRAGKVRRGRGTVGPEALDREGRFAESSEQAVLVRDLLEAFDAETQAAAVHYFVDEMSQEEVAAVVGLSVPTLRKRLRLFVDRARREATRFSPGPSAERRS